MATIVRFFETVDEMTAAADAAFEKGRVYEQQGGWFIGRRDINGWQDAKQKAGELWADGVETIKRLAEEAGAEVKSRPVSRKRRAAWSEDCGDELDIDRLRSGQSPWLECRRQAVTAPQQVTLVIDVTASYSRSAESIIWRGAAALVVADLLENAGFNVEIVAVFNVSRGFRNGSDYFLAYRIKRADQPIDIATLVNAISGWFFRTVVLQAMYCERPWPTNNHGRPLRLQSAEVVSQLGCSADPVIINNVWTQADAAQLVRRVIDSFQSKGGVPC